MEGAPSISQDYDHFKSYHIENTASQELIHDQYSGVPTMWQLLSFYHHESFLLYSIYELVLLYKFLFIFISHNYSFKKQILEK